MNAMGFQTVSATDPHHDHPAGFRHGLRVRASRFVRLRRAGVLAACALGFVGGRAAVAESYQQFNLVSDIPGMAPNTDGNLLNPWGIAYAPTGPFWISANHAGVAPVYNGNGEAFPPGNPLVVTLPPPPGNPPPAAPTGMVYNFTSDFVIGAGRGSGPARFIFAGEDGVISAWNPDVNATNAVIAADNSPNNAIYKGIALAATGQGNRLYAADFHNRRIDVFNSSFQAINVPGGFVDPGLPSDYSPFNIQNVGGALFVAYALPDANGEDDVKGPGHGFVDVFDVDGHLVSRFATQGMLNSPWAFALAPANFGPLSGALLIGNVGDGRINAFDPVTHAFLGPLADANGQPIENEELWGLTFGNGGNAGLTNVLYFTAGIGDEEHGLFGGIQVVPEPSSLLLLGGVALCALRRGR